MFRRILIVLSVLFFPLTLVVSAQAAGAVTARTAAVTASASQPTLRLGMPVAIYTS